MSVGLLSMHRVANYGSFWQAYCLRKMIEEKGDCDVEFIDIIPGEQGSRTEYKKTFSFSKIKRIPYYLFSKNKKSLFVEYQNKILGCSSSPNFSSDYDVIIIGSDEVFNCVQQSPWGFSTQLYGDIDNRNVNSYAACFGNTTYESILGYQREEKIAKGLTNLQNISVRDDNSAGIVNRLIGKMPEIHLDPVIVGDLPDNVPDIEDNQYILVYSYDFRLSDPDVIEQVKSLAKEKGLKIISAGFYQDWVDRNVLLNPYELLSYFKKAEYVVTDTFHGTIFSARMHRKFVALIRDSNKNKLGDLLLRIGMKERRYSKGERLKEIITKDINYTGFEQMRFNERMRTDSYLRKCLGK